MIISYLFSKFVYKEYWYVELVTTNQLPLVYIMKKKLPWLINKIGLQFPREKHKLCLYTEINKLLPMYAM